MAAGSLVLTTATDKEILEEGEVSPSHPPPALVDPRSEWGHVPVMVSGEAPQQVALLISI